MTQQKSPNPAQFAEISVDNLRDTARILFFHKWQILAVTAACVVLAALYCFTQRPLYLATATVLVEPKPLKAINVQDVYDPGFGTTEYFATQVEVIRSRQLAARVIDRLDLIHDPEFGGPASAANDAPSKERLIDTFIARLTVEPILRTQLIRVGFAAHTPELAAKISNALTDVFIEYGLEAKLEASRKATQWLTEKITGIRSALETSEKALQTYREQQQIVTVGGARGLAEEELLDNAKRQRDAQKKRTELASTYQKIQQAGTDFQKLEQISDILNIPLVQTARTNYLTAQDALKDLQQRYGEKHPLIAAGATRLQTAEKTYHDQLRVAAQGIKNEFEIARENEKVLGQTVSSGKERIRDLDRKEYDLRMLEREVDSNKQLYDVFLSSFKQTDATSSNEPVNVRVLEAAVIPQKTYKPAVKPILAVSFLLGLSLGCMLVLLHNFLNDTFRSAEELESLTHLPVMGAVTRAAADGKASLPQYFFDQPRTAFSEGIRSLRTGIHLNDVDKRYKRILMTSTSASEGKSSLAGCLGIALAATERTVLVEGDLRAPVLKKLFGIDNDRPGLMELLTGKAKLEECLYCHEASRLFVLPVARIPANPSEVIDSAAFETLIGALTSRFDRVILDSPPCNAASDSLILSKLADVVLFAVRVDTTHRRAVLNAIKQLRQINANILGTVINQIDPTGGSYYSHHNYYYPREYYGRAP